MLLETNLKTSDPLECSEEGAMAFVGATWPVRRDASALDPAGKQSGDVVRYSAGMGLSWILE